jgi:hypothetical protein
LIFKTAGADCSAIAACPYRVGFDLSLNPSIVVLLMATALVVGFLWWRWLVAAGGAVDFS